MRLWFAACLLLSSAASWADGSPEALDWLRRIHAASQKASYTGTFVYQHGNRSEASHITRLADAAGGVEKLEMMDGAPREIIRERDLVKCYLPDRRTVKIERRGDSRSFPALLPAQVGRVTEYYSASLGATQRIAGYECQEIALTPRDELRYGYRLWADVQSGMLLKAQTVDRKGEPIEQFTFTQLSIGNVSRDQVRPTHTARNWRIEEAGAHLANLAEAGWSVDTGLPGFTKLAEIKRRLRDSNSVGQMVYSDGMAAVSVFIEPLGGPRETRQWGLSNAGAINIYTREVANHRVTVVGETPAVSVERIGDMVRFRPPR